MTENARVHFFYLIGILIAIIVGLVTVKWASIPNLVSYLTFALTVSSLLLAILAIGYAFVSNNSLSQYLGQFSGVASEISKNAAELSSATENLDIKIQAIPPLLKDVGSRVERTEALLQEISLKTPSTSTPPASSDLDALAKRFVQWSSISGDLILYSLLLSFQPTIPFSLPDLTSKISGLDIQYSQGFLVAANSMGIIDFDFKKKIITVNNFNPALSNAFPAILDTDLRHAISDKHRADLVSRRKEIEQYFAE